MAVIFEIASALDKPFKTSELIKTPSPVVAIPVSAASASPVSTTVFTGRPSVLAKSRSLWS